MEINWTTLSWTTVLVSLGLFLGALLGANWDATVSEWMQFAVVPLLASALGAAVAYGGIRRNQKIQVEHEKLDKLNRAIFKVARCIGDLVYIKSGYFGELGTDRLRTIRLERYPRKFAFIDSDVSDIQFLLGPESDPNSIDVYEIYALFEAFNQTLHILQLREELLDKVLIAARKTGEYKAGAMVVNYDEFEANLEAGELDVFLSHGENLVRHVDTTLAELDAARKKLIVFGPKRLDLALLGGATLIEYKALTGSSYNKIVSTKVPEGEWEESVFNSTD